MRASRWLTIGCAVLVGLGAGGSGLAARLTASPAQAPPQTPPPAAAKPAAPANPNLERYKRDVGLEVDSMREDIARMNDQVFSFAELGFQEFETVKYLTDILKKNGFTDSGERRRHPDGVHGQLGIGQAGHRAGLRHRLHSAGVAKARRRVSRGDDRGRARSRRRAQLGHAAADCSRARGQEGDGAAAPAGDDPALAGCRRRTARHEGLLRPRRCLQGRRRRALRARRLEHERRLGRQHEQRPGVGRVQLQG